MLFDDRGEFVEDCKGIFLGEQEVMRGFKTGFELAQVIVTRYQHSPTATVTTTQTPLLNKAAVSRVSPAGHDRQRVASMSIVDVWVAHPPWGQARVRRARS
jgi:hypothetical protein